MPKNKDDDLKLIVRNVLNTDSGFKFVQHLLEETGVFNRAINYDCNKSYLLQGRSSIGEYMLELARKCDFEKFVELHKQRKD